MSEILESKEYLFVSYNWKISHPAVFREGHATILIKVNHCLKAAKCPHFCEPHKKIGQDRLGHAVIINNPPNPSTQLRSTVDPGCSGSLFSSLRMTDYCDLRAFVYHHVLPLTITGWRSGCTGNIGPVSK